MNNRNLKNDLKPLSGVKGLAAIGITCLYHYKNVYSNQGVTDFWLIHFPIINWWADQGWILVELFFTISGTISNDDIKFNSIFYIGMDTFVHIW